MFIEPRTNICLLRDVPFDNRYIHTMYFSDETEQHNYFTQKIKHRLLNQSYQRVGKGIARVQLKAEQLYDCNYMMFQNESFGSKWFYAFITSVEYINNIVSEIRFEIDVIQTWRLDCVFQECFIEREHVEDDTPGKHTVPENLETGEYVCDTFKGTNLMSDMCCVVASTFDYLNDYSDATGYDYCGIYSGLKYNRFRDTASLAAFLSKPETIQKSEGIVSIFMMPNAFAGSAGGEAIVHRLEFDKFKADFGFTPKNNKLYTYPYCFLYVTNMEGQSAVYHYEDFSTDVCSFNIGGDYSCSPSVVVYPLFYKGTTSNFDEKLVMSGFPQCAYNIDAFKAWLSQQGPSTLINAGVSTVTSGVLNPFLGGMSLVHNIASIVSQGVAHAIQPPQSSGGTSSNALVALKRKDFGFMNKHIKTEYAKIIDEYFNMYGYATHRIGTPNINGRPLWNYIKTVGCTMIGGAPADDIAKMCNIHDNGITYWKIGTTPGNYKGDNKPQ